MRVVNGGASDLGPVLALHNHPNSQIIRMSYMAGHCVAMQEACGELTKSFPGTHHLLDDAAESPCCLQADIDAARCFVASTG